VIRLQHLWRFCVESKGSGALSGETTSDRDTVGVSAMDAGTADAIAEAAVSLVGTKLPNRDVRYPVATRGKADMARTARFGRD
jgi:hypothetical protein